MVHMSRWAVDEDDLSRLEKVKKDPIEWLIKKMQDKAYSDVTFVEARNWTAGISVVLWAAVVAVAIMLPVRYVQANTIINQFDIMGSWITTLAKSSFEFLSFSTRAAGTVTYGRFPEEVGEPSA